MTEGCAINTVTLKFWYGGYFRRDEQNLTYMGRTFRTVGINPDEMGWFTLIEEAEKCDGFKRDVDGIFYLNANEGLRRAYDDKDAQIICSLAGVQRVVDCYAIPEKDVGQLMVWIEEVGNSNVVTIKQAKLIPRRKVEVKSKKNAFEKEGPPESSASITTLKQPTPVTSKPTSKPTSAAHKSTSPTSKPILPAHKSTSPTHTKTTLKSPKNSSTVTTSLKSSPRLIPEIPQKYSEEASLKTTSTVQQIQLSQTSEIDIPGSSFDFNTITVADLFSDYEELADKACLNNSTDLLNEVSDEGEEEDPGYVPEEDVGYSDDDDLSEGEEEETVEEEEGLVDDLGDDDDELQEARLKLSVWNANALKIAHQLEIEAAFGKLSDQNKASSSKISEVHLSDYDESGDEEDTPGESDEESVPGKRRSSSVTVVDDRTDYTKLKWSVGISFPTTDLFKESVIRYAVAQGRDLTFDISDKKHGKKLRVRCRKGCPFKLYGSWDNKTAAFVVKTVDPQHTCRRTMESNRQLKSTWLAKQFLDVFKANPHWPAKDIIETVRKAYKVLVKKDFAYKVKYYAHRLLHGSMKEHYSRIGSYIAALQQGNPTSTFTLFTNPTVISSPAVFQRFFVCFDALKQGWMHGCRKVLCVDACFLKTFLGGQLISAIGRDGNEQMFPLAWAVVEGENNESYEWFFQQLKASLGEENGEGWTIISDQHQSILTMVAKEFPRAQHRHCARHIFANWHKTYRGEEMKLHFWNCAKAYNEPDFEDALEALREIDHKAAEAFIACRPQLFCRAFIQTHTKNDVIVSNMAETFNAWIIDARVKHVIYMLEEIRSSLMQRLAEKKKEMEASNHVVCPKVQGKLEVEKDKAAQCTVLPSSTTLFQVTHGIEAFTVDLEARSCTCRKWDLTGIPCFHSVAAIFHTSCEAEDYVDDFYKREAYLRTYNLSITPCPGQRYWPKVDLPLNPPPIKIGPGRPRRKRRRDPFENPKKPGKLTKHGIEMSCSVCKSKTHNKRKCPDKDKQVLPPPKRPMGRPRKYVGPCINETPQPASEEHHRATAQPTRTGRGGRAIRTARGTAAATRRSGRRTGRGGLVQGVVLDDSGNVYAYDVDSTTGPRNTVDGISTQQSVNQE